MRWTVVTAAVEGDIDEAAARRIAREQGIELSRVFGKAGKPMLVKRLHGYNRAAAREPWWVLLDLDQDAECAPPHLAELLPNPCRHMKLRIVVRAIEAWFLSDRAAFAKFFRVRLSLIPSAPEQLADPKQTVVDLARQSSSSRVRNSVVPRPGSGRKVGPGYAATMIEFAERHWDPSTAAASCNSLLRCRTRLPERT